MGAQMGTQVEELAQRFEAANEAAIAAVERLDEAGLRAHCAAEQCTAAALAAHVGEAHPVIADLKAAGCPSCGERRFLPQPLVAR